MHVRLSTKNEIWHVGRGRSGMHDSMQYDPIQGQGHEPFKVPAIYNGSCMATDQ